MTSPVALESTAARTRPAPAGSGPVIEDLPRPRRVRSPSDVVRLVGALVLLIAGYTAAGALRDGVTTFRRACSRASPRFPDAARTTLVGVTQVAAVAAPAAIVVVLVLRCRFRLLLAVVLAALSAWLAATFALEDVHPPAWHLTAATESWLSQTSFPRPSTSPRWPPSPPSPARGPRAEGGAPLPCSSSCWRSYGPAPAGTPALATSSSR